MTTYNRYLAPLLALILLLAIGSTAAQEIKQSVQQSTYLPIVFGPPPLPPPTNPFGFDLRVYSSNETLQYVNIPNAQPKWTRAGDVFWSNVEGKKGEYNWESLAALEANVRRIRSLGIEPLVVVQRSPSWAQSVSGRLCSPMKPENIADFARFMSALAGRYSQGDTAINYWEIWNEPDIPIEHTSDDHGVGCWGNKDEPQKGGAYYGEMLKQVYPAIKSANPNAQVIAGALLYNWPDDRISKGFLEGLLASGAGNSFDMLSFHAYGEWGAGDLLINKAVRIREILQRYNMADKPLFASEIAAMCRSNDKASCPPDFTQWSRYSQANYAARIYAEAIALDLKGALWYTLSHEAPGFRYSHLIDEVNGKLEPRPSYYAFRNSALLLKDARYTGPPLKEQPVDQIDKVQTLTFETPNKSTLYVLWVPRTKDGFPLPYNLSVKPGAMAICTDHLDGSPTDPDPFRRLQRYDCSDKNRNGQIGLGINELPKYVEVFPTTLSASEMMQQIQAFPE